MSKRVVTVPKTTYKNMGLVLPDRVFTKLPWTDTYIFVEDTTIKYNGNDMSIAGSTFGRWRIYSINNFVNPNGYPASIPLVHHYADIYDLWRIRAVKMDMIIQNSNPNWPIQFGWQANDSSYEPFITVTPGADSVVATEPDWQRLQDITGFPHSGLLWLGPSGQSNSERRITRYFNLAKVEGKGLQMDADLSYEGHGEYSVEGVTGPTSNLILQMFTLRCDGTGTGTIFSDNISVQVRVKFTFYSEFYGRSARYPTSL